MKNRFKYLIIICCIIADVLAIMLSVNIFREFVNESSIRWYVAVIENLTLLAVISWAFSAVFFKMHSFEDTFSLDNLYRATWRVFLLHEFLFQLYIFYLQGFENYKLSGNSNLLQLTFLLFYLFLSRAFITYLVSRLKKWKSYNDYSLAIWGFNSTSIKLATQLEINYNSFSFKGILNEDEPFAYNNLQEFKNSLINVINYASKIKIQELYVVVEPKYIVDIHLYFALADSHCIRLKFIPDYSSIAIEQFSLDSINDMPIIKPRFEPLESKNNRFRKRIFDIVFSLFVIIFLLSWLYPILALIIKLQSSGPVLFKQLRTGENNKEFLCYKFRSMRLNSASNSKQAQKNDDRITKIGQFMRKTSIDELPQFYNVLKGEMSVVGPRPHMIKHTYDYNKLVRNFMVRHFVKPGITGLSQISGFRGETKEISDMQARVDSDIEYLQNWSLIKDLKICLLTVVLTLKGDKKAY